VARSTLHGLDRGTGVAISRAAVAMASSSAAARTSKPLLANWRASSRPMPLEAPVTTAGQITCTIVRCVPMTCRVIQCDHSTVTGNVSPAMAPLGGRRRKS
jgi:hypothetical protein